MSGKKDSWGSSFYCCKSESRTRPSLSQVLLCDLPLLPPSEEVPTYAFFDLRILLVKSSANTVCQINGWIIRAAEMLIEFRRKEKDWLVSELLTACFCLKRLLTHFCFHFWGEKYCKGARSPLPPISARPLPLLRTCMSKLLCTSFILIAVAEQEPYNVGYTDVTFHLNYPGENWFPN